MAIEGTAVWAGSWTSPVHEHMERSLHVQRRPTIASVPVVRAAREAEQTPMESVAPCPQELTGENSPLYTNQPAKTKTDRVLVKYFLLVPHLRDNNLNCGERQNHSDGGCSDSPRSQNQHGYGDVQSATGEGKLPDDESER
jgi:hypothetical protein